MAVWSIVNKGNIEGSSRIDAEYYQPNILEAVQKVERTSNNKLGSLVKSGYRVVYENTNILSREEVNFERDCLFIQAANISSDGLSFDVDNMGYVHEVDWIRYKKGRVIRGEVLIEVKGKAEKVAIVPSYVPERTLVSGTLYKLSLKKGMSHEYLYAYMSSKYGKLLRDRLKTNTLIAYVSKPDLYSIPVHLPREENDEEVKSLVQQAYKTVELSSKLYSQAEQILLEELGLKDLDLKDNLFYTTTLKEVKDNNRMDPEYYVPKHEKLMEHIFSFNYILLRKLAKFKKGVEPGSDKYYKIGKPFIRVSNLSKFEIINNNQKYLENNLYMQLKKSYEPKKGEILLSKDATPGVAYVLKESIEGIISSGILRLEITSSIKKEYLALIINSQIGQMQMKRDSGGSIINHWKIEEIKDLKVPLLADDTQEKIENLCCESFSKRKQARQLLEQAKHKVEEMIEKEAGVK